MVKKSFYLVVTAIVVLSLIAIFVLLGAKHQKLEMRNTLDARQIPAIMVALDPGHGGIDGGTGDGNGNLEKNLVLDIALNTKRLLEENEGIKVVLTRETDRELSDLNDEHWKRQRRDLNSRVKIAQEENAKILVSIHVNAASNSKMQGPLVFFQEESPKSHALAIAIATELANINEKDVEILPGKFYLLQQSDIPAVLVEVGFITNSHDRELLLEPSYQDKLAQAFKQGILSGISIR